MPILHYHLAEGHYSQAQHEKLLLDSARFFAEVLRCPVDRTRIYIHLYRPELTAVGGVLVSEGGAKAPYFSFVVLEGRSLEDRQRLLAGFTDLLVAILQVERSQVRGGIVLVHPENWAIAGVPAAQARQAEVAARAEAAKQAEDKA